VIRTGRSADETQVSPAGVRHAAERHVRARWTQDFL